VSTASAPRALDGVLYDLLRQLPKAELHCHLDGSLRPETMLELAQAYGVSMPRHDPAELAAYMHVDDARNLEEYLERFAITLSVMQHADAIERIAYELAVDAWRDGVWYVEARYCPLLNLERGMTPADTVDATLRGLARAERECGIVSRVVLCALRHLPPSASMEVAELAVAYRGRGVVAFDLAGGEAGNPARVHAEAFLHARMHDLACTCHAGEGAGADSVREAVHVCGCHRIGHATRLIEDAALTAFVNDRRIPLEICLTSNVQTRAVASYVEHPLRKYHDLGLPIVLCTDNRLMSATTLTDEYAHAASALGFGFGDLAEMAVRGFECAFLPYLEREAMARRARRAVEPLLREAGALGAEG
jgi:adenosine deaminase